MQRPPLIALITICALLISCPLTRADQPSASNGLHRLLPYTRFPHVSAFELLRKLGSESAVSVFIDDSLPDASVSIDLKNVTLQQVFLEVLEKANMDGATDGKTLFVLNPPIDKISPEATVVQMPLDDRKTLDENRIRVALKPAQDAYENKDYERAMIEMRNAVGQSYGCAGAEGYVYEIVRRFAHIYMLKGRTPMAALTEFGQDPFLSSLLLRFMKRESMETRNFETFKNCVAILNDPAAQQTTLAPSSGPAQAKQNSTSATGLVEQLNSLEVCMFGTAKDNETYDRRLANLEKMMFGQTNAGLSVQERAAELTKAIQPGSIEPGTQAANLPAIASSGQKNKGSSWFLNPAPIPWLNTLGRGARNTGKAIAQVPQNAIGGAHTVLKSPIFWETMLLAGAATGGYFLLRNSGGSSGFNQEHGCMGEINCHHCKNCMYCVHCNSGLNPCGVFYTARGLPVR